MEAERRVIFDKIFSPESLAIVGISRTQSGLGGQFFLKNLRRAGYPGRIYLIHPTAREINGLPVYPHLTSLPEGVDLAIVCVPAHLVPSVLEECIRKKIHNVHLLTSGFKELGTRAGIHLESELWQIASRGNLNIIGPNCMGPYVPASRLMLWGQIPAHPGSFAFLSQSGTLTQRVTEHAHFTGMGLSKAVSFGNAAVLDSTDYLEYLAEDPPTKVIGLYLESVRAGRRFLNLARQVNAGKPLVLWKGGETPSGAGAVASHTGTLAGENKIWESGLRQAGITQARSLEEVVGTAMAFLYLPPAKGRRLFILGGGGGNSVYYADLCVRTGLRVPPLMGETREKITALVPAVGSFARNPVDAWQAFYDPDYLSKLLEVVLQDPDLDLILLDRLIPRMTYATQERDRTPAVIEVLKKNIRRKPLAAVVDGGGEDPFLAAEAAKMRQDFCQAGIPAYSSLPLAAQALAHLAAYYEKKSGLARI
jgi:acyl-CoA synthetase (NDP forming)